MRVRHRHRPRLIVPGFSYVTSTPYRDESPVHLASPQRSSLRSLHPCFVLLARRVSRPVIPLSSSVASSSFGGLPSRAPRDVLDPYYSPEGGPTFQIGCRRRDAVRTRARQVHSRRLRAVEITRRVSNTAGSRIQPGAPRYDVRCDSHCGEAFSPLIQSHSQLDKVPRQSLLVSTTANQNERPLLALASKGPAADVADDSMTPITSVAILSLPQRARAEDAAFSPLALSHRPEPSPRPTAPRGGDQQRMGQW